VKTSELREKLEAASVELPGLPGRWVRAATALRIFGLSENSRSLVGSQAGVRNSARVRVPGVKSKVRFCLVSDCLAVMERRSKDINRRWTADDNRQVRSLYGRVPVEQLAAMLKRTPKSVYRQVNRLRLDIDKLALMRDSLLTLRMLADLCGVSLRRARRWVHGWGLRCDRLACGRRLLVVDLRDLRAWLMRNPRIFRQLPSTTADRLGLDIVGNEVVMTRVLEGAA
jgi:hypothetical protein